MKSYCVKEKNNNNNKIIKTEMWKQFTVQGNTQYLDILPKILKQYNNTIQSSIKMTPVEASKMKKEGIVYFNMKGNTEPRMKVQSR